jgi:hypothetical protein
MVSWLSIGLKSKPKAKKAMFDKVMELGSKLP